MEKIIQLPALANQVNLMVSYHLAGHKSHVSENYKILFLLWQENT